LEYEKAVSLNKPIELRRYLDKYPNSEFKKQIEEVLLKVELFPYLKGEFWGYCDAEKNIFIQLELDTAGFFKHNVAIVKKQGKYMLINKIGSVITTFNYDGIGGDFYYGLMSVKKNNLWGFIDTLGVEIIPTKYSVVTPFDSGYAKVYSMNKLYKGFSPLSIIYPFYGGDDFIEPALGGDILCDRICGVVNTKGEIVVPQKYFEIFKLNQYWIATKGEKYKSIFQKNGESEDVFYGEGNEYFDKWFLLSQKGEQLSNGYNHFYRFSVGMITVSNGGQIIWGEGYALIDAKMGYIDSTGKEIIPLIYKYAQPFLGGKASVTNSDNKSGLIDKKNNVIQLFKQNEYAYPTKNKWITYSDRVSEQTIYNNNTTKFKFLKPYTNYREATEGMMMVNISANQVDFGEGDVQYVGGKWGYINEKGIEVIPLKFDDESVFSESMAAVNIGKAFNFEGMEEKSGKWGYIDKTGKNVIPIIYQSASEFSNGYAIVENNNKYGIISKNNELKIPCEYIYLTLLKNIYFSFVKESDGKIGIISAEGKVIQPAKYDKLEKINEKNDFVRVLCNGKTGYIRFDGTEFFEE